MVTEQEPIEIPASVTIVPVGCRERCTEAGCANLGRRFCATQTSANADEQFGILFALAEVTVNWRSSDQLTLEQLTNEPK